MIQAALPFYQLLLPSHRLSRETQIISELFAASVLVDICTNIMNHDATFLHGEAERSKTAIYQAKIK